MYELLLRTETLFLGLPTHVLLGLGAGAILVGFVLWLGGTRYSAAITGVLGAVVGSAAGLLVGQWFGVHPWLAMFLGAVVLGGLAVLFRNILILVLAVLVFSAVSGTGYLAVMLDRTIPSSRPEAQAEASQAFQYFSRMDLDTRQKYMDDISQQAQTFAERLQALLANTWEAMGPHGWMVVFAVAGGALVGILLVWFLAKIIIALAYSLVGAAALFLGTQAALLAAGIPAVSHLDARRWLLPLSFLVLTVVGWIWQLLYGGPQKARREPRREAEPAD